MTKRSLLLISTLFAAACSHEPKDVSNQSRGEPSPVTSTSMEAKQVAAEQSAPYVTEISFAKGSSKLTSKAQEQIKELFLRSKGQREVSDANVITWADQEYPSENAKTLSKAQRNLADNRNKAIRDYLNELRASVDVHVHSMAERPTALKEFLKTADTRVKQSLETAGIPTTDQPKTGLPKASKSIVMLMLKEE